jgi:hypothetical protein
VFGGVSRPDYTALSPPNAYNVPASPPNAYNVGTAAGSRGGVRRLSLDSPSRDGITSLTSEDAANVGAFVTLGDLVNYKGGQLVISFTSTHSRQAAGPVIRFAHLATTVRWPSATGTGPHALLSV